MTLLTLRKSNQARTQLDSAQQKALTELYEQAYQEALAELSRYQQLNTATGYLQTLRLTQLTEGLKRIYTNLHQKLEQTVLSDMKVVSNTVVDETAKFYEKVGLKIGVSYASIPTEVVQAIKTGKVYEGNWTLSKTIWGQDKKILDDIQTIIAKDLALNKSSLEIAKDLEKYVKPSAQKPWDWNKVYPGVSTKIDYNAQRLARTLVSHAYQQSIMEAATKNPFAKGVKWLASNSHRTCQLCIDRSENDSYGLGSGVFPVGELPLDHPNGLCTFSIVLVGTLKQTSDRVAAWVNGASDDELTAFLKANNIAI